MDFDQANEIQASKSGQEDAEKCKEDAFWWVGDAVE
jgi:hypothetical protein